MAPLIREAREYYLKSEMVKGGKNREFPKHTARTFAIFIKEKRIVTFEGDAQFNPITVQPLKSRDGPALRRRRR